MSLLLLFNFQRNLVIDLGTTSGGSLWSSDFSAAFGAGALGVGGGLMIEAGRKAEGFLCPIEVLADVYSDSTETGYLDTGDIGETGLLIGSGGDTLAIGIQPWRGAVIEYTLGMQLGAVQSDQLSPIEVLHAAAADPPVQLELGTTARMDPTARIEALAGASRADPLPPIEVLLTAAADPPTQSEAVATVRADPRTPTEAQSTARADPPAWVEALAAAARSDSFAPIEALLGARADPPTNAEFGSGAGSLMSHSFAPIEVLQTVRFDNAPVEWAALLRSDALPLGEFMFLARIDPAAAVENTALGRRDLLVPAEALSAAARGDASLAIEALLSAVRDFVPVEFGALLRSDPQAPTEAGETVRADPGTPAEVGGGVARADAQLPLEALLLRQGRLVPVEFQSVVRALIVSGDSITPLEWAGIMRSDGAPMAEWAALSASDRNALIEWFRTLAVDLTPAVEDRQTNPAPLYFISRGRLKE